jgi:hypothetical protein
MAIGVVTSNIMAAVATTLKTALFESIYIYSISL